LIRSIGFIEIAAAVPGPTPASAVGYGDSAQAFRLLRIRPRRCSRGFAPVDPIRAGEGPVPRLLRLRSRCTAPGHLGSGPGRGSPDHDQASGLLRRVGGEPCASGAGTPTAWREAPIPGCSTATGGKIARARAAMGHERRSLEATDGSLMAAGWCLAVASSLLWDSGSRLPSSRAVGTST
jgi:hypothetical protein